MTPELNVLGVDPGGGTGWCRITIPRLSIFGDEPPRIIEWDYGLIRGTEPEQAIEIARLAREIQSLTYKVGPAIVVEDWDITPTNNTTDPESLSPVRIGAMLRMLHHQTNMEGTVKVAWLGDSTLTFQGRTIAKTTMTDDRLKSRHMYVEQKDIRDATRHALTMLRRAHQNPELAADLWPYAAQHA